MVRSVNGGTRPTAASVAPRPAEAPGIKPLSPVRGKCRAHQHEAVVRDFRITAADRVVAESKRLGERGAKATSGKGEE